MKIRVKVKTNSKQQKIVALEDSILVVHLTYFPIRGQANQELIELLAPKYQVTKSQVTITSGLTSKK